MSARAGDTHRHRSQNAIVPYINAEAMVNVGAGQALTRAYGAASPLRRRGSRNLKAFPAMSAGRRSRPAFYPIDHERSAVWTHLMFAGKLRRDRDMGAKCAKWSRFAAIGLAAVVAFAAACAHAPPPPPAPCASAEPLRLSLRASAHVNPSEKGDALATVVRVYQLKGTGRIAVASFDDLLDHDKDALGEDFVAVQEVTVNPNETTAPPLARSADATYVAVVGLFRQPASTTWRAIEKLPAPNPQYCHAAAADHGRAAPGKDPTLRFVLDDNRIVTMKNP